MFKSKGRQEKERIQRYHKITELDAKVREKIVTDSKLLINTYLDILRGMQNRAEQLKVFDRYASYFVYQEENLKKLKSDGKKIVGTLCIQIPHEIIVAGDAIPVRLCTGFHSGVPAGDRLVGDVGLCPLVKSTLGIISTDSISQYQLCDLIVVPTTCDGKMKLAEIMQDYTEVIILNMPRIKEGDAIRYMWYKEIEYLKRMIEDLTDVKITRKKLKTTIQKYQKASEVWHRFNEFRKLDKVPIWGCDALFLPQSTFFCDIQEWVKNMELLCTELDTFVKNGVYVHDEESPRVMLAGSPIIWPNWKLPNIIESKGGLIVCDELCSTNRLFSDPVVVDEYTMKGMLMAIAERYFYPCTCPCFVPNDERELRILQMVKEFKVDGVVYHTLRGCHLNALESARIDKTLKEHDIPILKIDSAYETGDEGQIRIRVEAFLEMLHARKEEDLF